MTSTQDSTVAARIPLDLRADLEGLAESHPLDVVHGRPSMTPHIRRALRQYVDRELGRTPGPATGLFAPAEGASHNGDPATSRQAARDTAPRTGGNRYRALLAIDQAGDKGRTADELLAIDQAAGLKPAGNGPARRVSELKATGAIEPVTRTERFGYSRGPMGNDMSYGDVHTRTTRAGSEATVYVITAKGKAWLEAERRRTNSIDL